MAGLVTPVDPVPLEALGRVHFAGIGGAGMSGIARIMLARGVQVSGSDSAASPVLDTLAALGAKVHVGHAADNLGDADTLVVSSAIRDDNPELDRARRRGLRVLHRAGALAAVMYGRRVIAVTGTHGKTSTTSMLATILLEAGADPGYAIGGTLAATGTNAADGGGRDFVAEADESDGSFLMYHPDAAVITNIEADHLDNHGTPEAYRNSFAAFTATIKPGGLLVTCADDPPAAELAAPAQAAGLRVRTYGESAAADYRVGQVAVSGMRTDFTVTVSGDPFGINGSYDLSVGAPGRHNALNAAAAFAAVCEIYRGDGARPAEAGISPGRAADGLRAYRGAARRMEPKGEAGGVRVFDTYAHHPTELAADLRAARGLAGGDGRVVAVFQPHLYSRTRIFAAELGAALGLADVAVVLDVYAAREDPEPGVTGRLVADAVPGAGASEDWATKDGASKGGASKGGAGETRVRYVPVSGDVPAAVAAIARPGDVVLTMGAGDVTRLGPLILSEIAAR